MYISSTEPASLDEEAELNQYFTAYPDSSLVVMPANDSTKLAWLSNFHGDIRTARGIIVDKDQFGVNISLCEKKIFAGDRRPFQSMLGKLSIDDQRNWNRLTFSSDCRLPGAFGLRDEQAWCEAAFNLDKQPDAPTAYVVGVIGSKNYFGYFNFFWEDGDSYKIKSCHDLHKWCTLYVPNFFVRKKVERWVFLQESDLAIFRASADSYRRMFAFLDFPFDVFSKGES